MLLHIMSRGHPLSEPSCKIVISNAEQTIIGSLYSVTNIKETHSGASRGSDRVSERSALIGHYHPCLGCDWIANMSYADETKDILKSNVSLKVMAFELCDEVQYFPCCDYFSLKLTKNIC